MKPIYISIIFLLLVFLNACETNKSKIEIIPNYDIGYYLEKEVDKIPTFRDSSFNTDVVEVLQDMVKTFAIKEGYKDGGIFPTYYDLYISTTGEIEKIKSLPIPKKYESYPIHIFPDAAKRDLAFAMMVQEWELTPAILEGQPVKVKKTLQGSILLKKDGQIQLGIGPLFLPDFSLKKEYHLAVEQMPEPIGGIAGIQKRIKYPEIARRAGIEGRVFVKAYINENGEVSQTEVIKGIGGGCDEAAVDAVKQTKFKPGKQRGKTVKVQVSIPILFKLK